MRESGVCSESKHYYRVNRRPTHGHRPLVNESVHLSQADITSPPTHHDFLHTEDPDRDKTKVQFQSTSPRRTVNSLNICDKSKSIEPSPTPQHHRAARPAYAANTSPGESRAIWRICGKRCHPQTDLNHGNNFSHREGATGAAIRRNRESPLAPSLPGGNAAPAMAIAKGQTRRPGAQSRCFGDPAEEKKQPRNSSL